jgi:integrase
LLKETSSGRRPYGTGSLFVHRDAWYGKWYVGSRQVKRKVGARRSSPRNNGLTKAEAERELRRLMRVTRATPLERLTLREVGDAYIAHLRDFLERKPSTVQDYECILGKAERILSRKFVDAYLVNDIDGYIRNANAEGRSTKTICNHLIFLQGLFGFAVKRGWAQSNPVAAIERPRVSGSNPDIRHIDQNELRALLTAIPDDPLGRIELPLYLTATMCGLRQGELIALRWQDIDAGAGVIRVRRSFTRGQLGTPKSRRSSRAVPMPRRVASEVESLASQSQSVAADELVFGHPETGRPYDASKLRKRFKDAVGRAEIRPIRFHDLRHTFGTRMAAAGAPLRNIQEWMGHGDYRTTLIYADYAPDPVQGARWAEAAFSDGGRRGSLGRTK